VTPGAQDDGRSDQELVAVAGAGEADAFEALYRRHRDWAWSLARRFCPTAEDAADVMQDAFLHLWHRFPGFSLTARSLRSYLYPVVRHLALERRHRGERQRAAPVEELTEETPEIRPPGEVREELARALANLPPAQAEVLLMRFVDDFELAEIADALHVPLGTVKSRLHHALERLPGSPRRREAFLG